MKLKKIIALPFCRFARCSKGATMMEFALVAPVLFTFLIGTLEVGLIRFGNSLIDNMVAQLARASMVGCRDNEFSGGACNSVYTMDVRGLRQMIQRKSGGLVQACNASRFVINADTVQAVSASNPVTNRVNLGQGGEVIVFYARYDWPVFFPLMTQLLGYSQINYETVTIVRNEPFGNMGSARVVNNPNSPANGC